MIEKRADLHTLALGLWALGLTLPHQTDFYVSIRVSTGTISIANHSNFTSFIEKVLNNLFIIASNK